MVANVDGEFYPSGPGSEEQIIEILARQVASPVQFVKGLHTLYDAGARVFVETGPKRALWGFAADVLGDDVMTLFTNHPKVGEVASFNQALGGLYAAGVGPRENGDVYGELGRMFADVIARGQELLGAAAPEPVLQRDDEPVVITGAASGTPGTEKVFDDGNLSRLLHGEQLIDVIPSRMRREIAEHHITRLVKSEDGTGTFQTIDDPADVIKLAARAGALDLATEFGVDADRLTALGRETQLAIAAGIDALRDAGIPLVQHYKDTTRGTKLPDKWRLPDALRDDTGVIFASAFPGVGRLRRGDRPLLDRARRGARGCEEPARGARPQDAGDGARRRSTAGSPSSSASCAAEPVPLRPPLPVPRALDGALPDGRADRRARPEHADQRRVREHDAGRRGRRGLDPRRPLPARADRGRRRRDVRRRCCRGSARASWPRARRRPTRWSRRPRCRSTGAATG